MEQPHPPTRVLVWIDQQPIAEMVSLTLNHGVCVTREVSDRAAALAAVEEWGPELAVVDMDIADERLFAPGIGDAQSQRAGVPVLALTRRGDLKTKLTAFERGVDDIMTVPFSPEELLARVVAIVKRVHRRVTPINPVIKMGEIEIDINEPSGKGGPNAASFDGVGAEPALLPGGQRGPGGHP